MYKKGIYAKYNEKEYKIIKKDDSITLISNDPLDMKAGFEVYKDGILTKNVSKEELSNPCKIKTFGRYKGYDLIINGEYNGEYLLGADSKAANELDFPMTDKYFYEKWVPKNEVKLIEERKEIEL
ncbi:MULTISPECIES: hypothetical protein [Bacillus]|uniref:Uncharacterized protein n=2 Tax=Bacillus TaxID=1386 RepID=A0A0M4FN87_9BACI|nr:MULTISPECIES: hypothetical protein [Bacillus]ALC80310.1 hypothetical protein AM592_00860 [Bacillus gobiensis]MBP1083854.1 hypothetical protein [Bacillus capparidis]MED1098336.1 hypothetical protein [Bacillus capparidis]